jgi:hypothetical protein
MKTKVILIIVIASLVSFKCNKTSTEPENSTNVIYGVKWDLKDTATLYKMDLDNLEYQKVAQIPIYLTDGYDGLDFNIDGNLYLGVAATGNLFKIDTVTGAATFVRNFPLSYGRIMECIAFAPVKVRGPEGYFPAGTLFGAQGGTIYAINIETGEVQVIGDTGHDNDAFAFSEEGVLYGIDGAKSVYTIDTETGESKEVISNPLGWGNLTFAADGFLYSAYWRVLYRLDPATGSIDSLYYLVDETVGLASTYPFR